MSKNQYAFQGAGTFSGGREFSNVTFLDSSSVAIFDTTGAIELLFDVATFNKLIGITKDADNVNVTSTDYYDSVNDKLAVDSITLTATQLTESLNLANIYSVGKFSTLYTDYAEYVAIYFGMPTNSSSATTTNTEYGFANLFSKDYNFNPYNGIFGAQELLDMVTTTSATDQITSGESPSGAYVNNLTGSITLNNITGILRNAVFNNQFNNRSTITGTTASDSNDRSNYGVSDGFFDGDLLFIPSNGISITLGLGIQSTSFKIIDGQVYDAAFGTLVDTSFNNLTKSLTSTIDGVTSTTTSTFKSVSESTSNLISRSVSAPLLIRLTNMSIPYVSLLNTTFTPYSQSISLSIKGDFDHVTITVYSTTPDKVGGTVIQSNYPRTSLTSVTDSYNMVSYLYSDSTVNPIGTFNYYTITPSLLGSNGNNSSYSSVFLPTFPSNWYKCNTEDLSSNILNNFMPGGKRGSLLVNTTISPNSKSGSGSLQFDGSSSYFLSDPLNIGTNAGDGITFSLWFKGVSGCLVSHKNLNFNFTADSFNLLIGDLNKTENWQITSDFNHLSIVCSYDAVASINQGSNIGNWVIYLNNVVVDSFSGPYISVENSAHTSYGSQYDGSNYTNFLNGNIDDIREFVKPITALDVNYLYNN